MRPLLAALRLIYCLYALVLFVSLMFCVAPFVILASLMGKVRGGNVIYRLCSLWADVWLFLVGIVHRNIYEVPHDRGVQYIFVANHISYMDAPIIVKTLRQPVRVLGKSELSAIPVFGFIYRKAVVTVNRSSSAQRAASVRVLKSVLKRNISIFLFPEGTFNETHQPLKEFFDGAFRIAIETQTPVKPILFLDAYSRMPYERFFSLTPGRSRSVFLAPVSVSGLTLKDLPQLKASVFEIMERALIRYRSSWINSDTVSKHP